MKGKSFRPLVFLLSLMWVVALAAPSEAWRGHGGYHGHGHGYYNHHYHRPYGGGAYHYRPYYRPYFYGPSYGYYPSPYYGPPVPFGVPYFWPGVSFYFRF